MCSSFHSANGDHTGPRRVKIWTELIDPIPAAMSNYNKRVEYINILFNWLHLSLDF